MRVLQILNFLNCIPPPTTVHLCMVQFPNILNHVTYRGRHLRVEIRQEVDAKIRYTWADG